MAVTPIKISYIFLCDGPCTSSSWKDDDRSVYWARRDALVRISILCLWQGPRVQSSVSDDCSLLFHEVSNVSGSIQKEDLLAAMTMSGPELVPSLPIPNERLLMQRWRDASSYASKFPQKAEIGSAHMRTSKVM